MDALQKVSDAPLEVCPECNESALVKKVSAAGFRLKGSGWYETDFKSGKKRNVAGGADSSPDSGKSSSDAAGEKSKSAEKAPAGSSKPGSGTSGSSDT